MRSTVLGQDALEPLGGTLIFRKFFEDIVFAIHHEDANGGGSVGIDVRNVSELQAEPSFEAEDVAIVENGVRRDEETSHDAVVGDGEFLDAGSDVCTKQVLDSLVALVDRGLHCSTLRWCGCMIVTTPMLLL